jgi:hypothetical protein
MDAIGDFVKRQKVGARFVITGQMMRLRPEEFDALAQVWIDDGGPGFNVVGVPHRAVVDGRFYTSRITVIKTSAGFVATE